MFCSNCGNKQEDGANFCPKCGSKVAGNAPAQPSASFSEPSEPDDTGDTFTDKRDGKVYKTVKIGNQVWMAENLAYNAKGSRIYDDDPAKVKTYGRLYDWETAMKACPEGWHLPSYWEWEELVKEAGGAKNAAKNLCTEGIPFKYFWLGETISEEYEEVFTSTDYFGFAALLGGYYGGEYNFIDSDGYWWSSSISKNDESEALYVQIKNACPRGYSLFSFFEFDNFNSKNSNWYSVRCVKGPPPKKSTSGDKAEWIKNGKSFFERMEELAKEALEYQGQDVVNADVFAGADTKPAGNCPKCSGKGKIRVKTESMFGEMVTFKTCPDCNGTGGDRAPATAQTSQNPAPTQGKTATGTFTDPRDGKAYKTVKIGKQTWMAENLAFGVKGSRCYDDDPDNGEKYGRLYTPETAAKAYPKGWHLPSRQEWQELIDFVADSEQDGKKLKSSSGWGDNEEGESGSGTDDFGFAALPGGRCSSDFEFSGEGEQGLYWYKEDDGSFAYAIFQSSSDEASFDDEAGEEDLLSVRCVRD